jgi:hypothetical protein
MCCHGRSRQSWGRSPHAAEDRSGIVGRHSIRTKQTVVERQDMDHVDLVPRQEVRSLANIVDVARSAVCQYPEVYAPAVRELTGRDSTSVINERKRAVEVQRSWSVHCLEFPPQ